MPLTLHIRLPVTDEEHEALVRKAGDVSLTTYLRNVLGLAPRKPGRPRSPKPKAR